MDFSKRIRRVIALMTIIIVLLLGLATTEVMTRWSDRKHFHSTIINNPYSQDTGECGIIPKVKLHNRSRDPGIASFGQIPWQAGIFHKPTNAFLGSGTLISADLILTSPIIVITAEEQHDLEIRLGDWDISEQDSPQESYDHLSASVAEVLFYPEFMVNVGVNPIISLIRLKEPVDFHRYPHIAPICLPPLSSSVDSGIISQCFVSGWGAQNRNFSFGHNELSQAKSVNSVLDPLKVSEEYILNGYAKKPGRSNLETEGDIPLGSGNSLESQQETFPSNNKVDDLQGFRLNENSNSKQNNHPVIKVPDPVDDYLDEFSDYVASPTESDGFKDFFDDDSTKMEDHESSIYNHKLKYKKGKMSRRKQTVTDNNEVAHTKRYVDHHKHKRSSGKHRKKALYQSHAEPSKLTLLKLFRVQIYDNCLPKHNQFEPSSNNHCISPKNGHYTLFPCMVDIGSPVFCTSQSQSIISRFSTAGLYSNFPIQGSPKLYLMGFVGGWTPSCYDVGSLEADHSSSVAITPFSIDIIKYIYETI